MKYGVTASYLRPRILYTRDFIARRYTLYTVAYYSHFKLE